jgi:aquaporin Z
MFNKYLVEFFGSCFFIFIVLATGNPIAIGASLALAILLTKDISGGHINPVISVTMASIGKIPINDLVPYILAQVFGGLVALEIYKRVQFT